MRSLGVSLVLTLQTEDQSSAATRGRRLLPDYGEDRPALPCGEDLLAFGEGNKSELGTVHVVFTMSKLRRLYL